MIIYIYIVNPDRSERGSKSPETVISRVQCKYRVGEFGVGYRVIEMGGNESKGRRRKWR